MLVTVIRARKVIQRWVAVGRRSERPRIQLTNKPGPVVLPMGSTSAAHQFQRQGGNVDMVILFNTWPKYPTAREVAWHKWRQDWKQAPKGGCRQINFLNRLDTEELMAWSPVDGGCLQKRGCHFVPRYRNQADLYLPLLSTSKVWHPCHSTDCHLIARAAGQNHDC